MRPENIVWIFGTGRSGSTWLMRMMAEMPRSAPWDEPKVGNLFGRFYEDATPGERAARKWILADSLREQWLSLVREFVLGSIAIRRPKMGPKARLIVKEPNASVGAPIILSALPESRTILLIRDPRDLVASVLDASKEGSWLQARRGKRAPLVEDKWVALRAEKIVESIGHARRAHEAHPGPKVLVRYEDLRAAPVEELVRIHASLRLPYEREDIQQAVAAHSWESIPQEKKGPGKIFRKATPGSWREDLTPEQVRIVEEITAPLLEEFYPEGPTA